MTVTIVETCAITGGVDTHADAHVAAALDPIGGLLGVQEFPATAAGYARLLDWLGGFGTVCLAGISRGRAATAPAWPATSLRPVPGWWRWTAPAGAPSSLVASPGAWTS